MTPPSVHLLDEPLIQDRLGRLRDRDAGRADVRRLVAEMAALAVRHVLGDVPVRPVTRQSPKGPAASVEIEDDSVLLVPVLRAGLALLAGAHAVVPRALVGMIGVHRDEDTKRPVEYLVKLPPDPGGPVVLLDPMLATGGTAAHALDVLRTAGVGADRLRFLALIAAPEGVALVRQRHPEVPIWLAAIDSHLDAAKEIVPGLGDLGDRLYGT
jgi:uracil phosphoribosyltransferase